MLKEELEAVKVHARIIAKEEIAAMPKPEDRTKGIKALIEKLISEAVSPLSQKIERLEIASVQTDSKKKGGYR